MLLPSPSTANATGAGAAHNSFKAKEENTGRAQAETTTDNNSNEMDAGSSILAGVSLPEPTGNCYDMAGFSTLAGVSPAETADNYCDMAGSFILAGFASETTNTNDTLESSVLAVLAPEMTMDSDNMAQSSILAGFSPAIASSPPVFSARSTSLQTLSLVGEGEQEEQEEEQEEPGLFLSQVGSRSSSSSSSSSPFSLGVAFPPPPRLPAASSSAVVHTISLADEVIGAEPEIIAYESGSAFGVHGGDSGGGDSDGSGYARSGGSETDSFLVQWSEDEEEDEGRYEGEAEEVDNSLALPASTLTVSEEERSGMTTRLVEILRGLDDPQVAARGEYLARYCSLSRCEDNFDLTWHEVLGEGQFGRVSLVLHEFGRYAVKELIEVRVSLFLRTLEVFILGIRCIVFFSSLHRLGFCEVLAVCRVCLAYVLECILFPVSRYNCFFIATGGR